MDSENYGTKCVLIEEKSCESSVALHRQETPQKAKDVKDYLNGELHRIKKDANKNAWNMKNKMCVSKETIKHNKREMNG